MDGTEYIVILKGTFTALGAQFESPVPIGLKNGNGVTKRDLSSLFALIAPGVGRSIEVTGGEVWGPLGPTNAAACQAVVATGYGLLPGDPTCRGGTLVGVAGLNIP